MDYNKIPGKIEELSTSVRRCMSSILEIERRTEAGHKSVRIRLQNSGTDDFEVNSEDLRNFLEEQNIKLRKEVTRLEDVDETLRKVSVGLL